MTDETARPRIYLGSYVGGTSAVIVPASVLRQADDAFAAERRKREALASEAAQRADSLRLKNTRRARMARRLKRGLRQLLRGGIH
jgi:hypothetical protein